MTDVNPYQSPERETLKSRVTPKPGLRKRWALIGFAVGAAAPATFGLYGMQQHYAYVSSLGPNEAACGMGALGAIAMIVVAGPFCGMFGATLGWVTSGINWR